MSNRYLMELVLHDLLFDLMALHRVAKSQRTKLRIEKVCGANPQSTRLDKSLRRLDRDAQFQ
jgi:hypothetical protein